LLLAALLSTVGYQVFRRRNAQAPEVLLRRADDMSWLNDWMGAEPLYRQAELQFIAGHQLSEALYARVSEMPAQSESSTTVPTQIAILQNDLVLPEAQAAETKLRILTILGMLEVNYDSGMARQTWAQVQNLAAERHHYLLASRAVGEEGIAAFLLGDIATAKKDVVKAWMVAKFADPAAHIRYASMYGTGLVELHKYKEALGPLNEAIKVAGKTPGVAYPTIAITSKIEALSGLGDNKEALDLTAEEMQKVSARHLVGHLYELYETRSGVYERMDKWDQAVSDFTVAAQYAKRLSYWRGLTQVDESLAEAYLHQGDTQSALTAIDEGIDANKKIPDELYFVPTNLAIKARILAKLGKVEASNDLYEKSADLLDALLSKVPTPMVERQLLSDLSTVFAGYSASLCDQGRFSDAFRVIERARGRLEAQALSHHDVVVPHEPSAVELHLTKLNLQLLETDDPSARGHILEAIYTTEQQLSSEPPADDTPPSPVPLTNLQRDLRQSELFVEYVLDDPHSYALAITQDSVHRYTFRSKSELEQDATQYRSELMHQKTDLPLAQRLFDELLGDIREFRDKQTVIGTGTALTLTHLISSFLFGVKSWDPAVLITVPVLLSCVALIAVWVPAARGSRMDPMQTLRAD
jgi:tetratricopeptide (TPR) repeat protein